MNNLPIELVGRIMAYLPILDVVRVELNYEIIKSLFILESGAIHLKVKRNLV